MTTNPLNHQDRRDFTRKITLGLVGLGLINPATSSARQHLPLSKTFKGVDRFYEIVRKAQAGRWQTLPMGQRVMAFAKEFHRVPYVGFTLEIDDRIESPSANMVGLDCWTFFEIALGFARMIEFPRQSYTPSNLLSEIEWTRYRGGVCNGNYLDRIHYLAEWFFEAEARGIATDITRELGHSVRLKDRAIQEMTILWKSYRYLANNPDLRAPMARHEERVSKLPVYYIPREKVHLVEPKLQAGDVLGIVTRHDGGFCSHVGLLHRGEDKIARLMHASRNYKKVVIDKSISGYLNHYSSHLGLMVGRPLPRAKAIVNRDQYLTNIRRLTGMRNVGP